MWDYCSHYQASRPYILALAKTQKIRINQFLIIPKSNQQHCNACFWTTRPIVHRYSTHHTPGHFSFSSMPNFNPAIRWKQIVCLNTWKPFSKIHDLFTKAWKQDKPWREDNNKRSITSKKHVSCGIQWPSLEARNHFQTFSIPRMPNHWFTHTRLFMNSENNQQFSLSLGNGLCKRATIYYHNYQSRPLITISVQKS